MLRITTLVLTLLVAGSLVLAGCGQSASDKLGEKLGEKVAEEATGAKDVDIDEDGGKVTVKGKDGEEVEISSGKELPDGWPDEVPLPDGAKITSAGKVASGKDGDNFVVSATVEDSASDILKFYKKELSDMKETASMQSDNDNAVATYTGKDFDVTVTVSKQGADTVLAMTVTPPSTVS